MLVATFRVGTAPSGWTGRSRRYRSWCSSPSVSPHSTTRTMPCFWAAADEFDDEKYSHLDWADGGDQRVTEYLDQRGSLLEARATAAGWEVQFRFVDRDQFDTFRELLAERDHSFETTQQSVSELLRRGTETLVRSTLITG